MTCKLHHLIISHEVCDSLKSVTYGTAGFRMNSKYLDGICVRMGFLASIRSIFKNATVGLMITASHNLETDNGIKIIDPNGDMLSREWESVAMELVRWPEAEFLSRFREKCSVLNVSFDEKYKGNVLIGYDTRSSSPHLAQIVSSVFTELGTTFSIFEIVTTPQLHFFVKYCNENPTESEDNYLNIYFNKLYNGFCFEKEVPKRPAVLNVDCANGVGAKHLSHLARMISSHLELRLHNIGNSNLNLDCGADHVKIKQNVPTIHNGDKSALSAGNRWCSVDGDADRLVYFFIDNSNQFLLLDGDKMAVLMADFLSEILQAELNSNRFSMAIIQTAYANSASTEYIENHLKVQTECVPTGVKYLHEAAKKYDIGIYFEANGHGTVLFSEKLKKYCESSNDNKELKRFVKIINEADGDAISDMLIIEHILFVRNWSLNYWSGLYTDYPSRQLKVDVPDRNIIITTDAERRIESPILLQNEINKIIENQLQTGIKHSRAFVRPSGTEDIVRIYAESSTQSNADQLANSIELIIRKYFANC